MKNSNQATVTKNVLLVNMSTIGSTTESYYGTKKKFSKKTDWETEMAFRGISQLEVGTKYFLRKLQKSGKKLDQILILASEATLEFAKNKDVFIDFSKGFNTNFEIVNESDKEKGLIEKIEDDAGNVRVYASAVAFYKKRIEQYILGQEISVGTNENLNAYVEEYEKTLQSQPLKEEYLKDSPRLFDVITIPNSEENPDDSLRHIQEMCEKIRDLKKQTNVDLYIDMQGSQRYQLFLRDAVVKMMENEGIYVKDSVAIDFNPNNNKKNNNEENMNKIVDTMNNNRVLDMVAGMNEFVRTGRADTLIDYFKKEGTEKYKLEKELIDQIEKISNAISLCEPDAFDEALQGFENKCKEYKGKKEKKHPLFVTFVESLEKDYKGIIKSTDDASETKAQNDDATRIRNQIEWCMKKKLYQQALTLVEARFPKVIVDSKILHYGDEKELKRFILWLKENGIFSGQDYLWKSNTKLAHKEGEKFIFIKYFFKEMEGTPLKIFLEKDAYNVVKAYKINEDEIDAQDCRASDGKNLTAEILQQYKELSKLRNSINHANAEKNNEDRTTKVKSKIEELLRTYDKAVSEKINFDYAKCLKRSLTRHLRKSDYKKHLQNMNKNNPSVPIEDNDPIFQLIQQMRNGLVHMQKMEEKENFDGFYESRTKYPALFMIIDRLEFPEGADKTTSRNSYEELFNNYEAEKPWSKKIMNKIANNKSKNVSEWLITYYEAQSEITSE